MALRIPLVEINGEISRLPSGDNIQTNSGTVSRVFMNSAILGQAVYAQSNTAVGIGMANADSTRKIIGLVTTAVTEGNSGDCRYEGVLSATTAEWDAVAGTTGGLTQGSYYYLSSTTTGMLIDASALGTITTGHYLVRVGQALSTTELLVKIEQLLRR